MKYMCLVYGEEKDIQAMTDDACLAYDKKLRDSGRCIASEALQSVRTAATASWTSVCVACLACVWTLRLFGSKPSACTLNVIVPAGEHDNTYRPDASLIAFCPAED